jgi:Na+/H+ antiporter NhaD/arsenite permease-like protein
MSFDAYTTLAILVLTFLALFKSKIPAAAVFAAALTAAVTLKLAAPIPMLLKGFSNQGMLAVTVLFIVATGMCSTGAVGHIVKLLVGSRASSFTAQLKMLPGIAVGSAFLNNTPLVAMMIPVIRDMFKDYFFRSFLIILPAYDDNNQP